jgi:tetratricopeptide (TPR) repeat protein
MLPTKVVGAAHQPHPRLDAALTHQSNIGILMWDLGKPEETMASFRKTLAIRQELVDANPAVSVFQLQLAVIHYNIGNLLLLKMGKPEEAIASFRKALAIEQKLAEANPKVPDYQSAMASSLNNLGEALVRQKRFAEAFTAIDAGLAIKRKLVEAYPKNKLYSVILSCGHTDRGSALVRSGQPSEAAADLRRAVELFAKDPALDVNARYERSRALALLAGLGEEAKSGVTKAEAALFADQAIASLRDAIKAGWNKPDALEEPDFGSLRGRDDFKKLLAELEARDKAKAAKKD